MLNVTNETVPQIFDWKAVSYLMS